MIDFLNLPIFWKISFSLELYSVLLTGIAGPDFHDPRFRRARARSNHLDHSVDPSSRNLRNVIRACHQRTL
jgi:hypothetical protein